MNKKRIGKRTIKLNNKPTIIAASSIVGPKEGEGPLKDKFDLILSDDLYGEKTWELSESKMVQTVMEMSVKKANKTLEDVDFLDRKSTRLNSSHKHRSRMPSSA